MRRIILFLVLTGLVFSLSFSIVPTTESFLNLYISNMSEILVPQAKTISKWIAEKSIQWAITDNGALLTEAQNLVKEYGESEDVKKNPFTSILNQSITDMEKKMLIHEKIRFERISDDILIYMLNPRNFYKGGRTTLTFLIGNTSNSMISDFNIEIDSIYMPDTQETLRHNDDVYETIELQPGGLGVVQIHLSTNLEQLSGEYHIKYQFEYRKNSDEIITEYQKTAVFLSGPNQMINTLDITPAVFHRGSRIEMAFLIKNRSNKIYKDINLEIEQVEREIYQESLGVNDDYVEDITLRPGEEGQIKAILDSDTDDPEGLYNMLYYYHFYELNGDDYRTPLYLKKINMIKANNDLKYLDLEPLSVPQNSRVYFNWYVKNTGEQFFKDINIEIDRITRDITGEALGTNDNIEEEKSIPVRIRTKHDDIPGAYILRYYLYFNDHLGNRYETNVFYTYLTLE